MDGRRVATSDKITAPAAAREAGCSLKTLNRAIDRGDIRVLGRRGGTGVRYVSRAELEAWMLGQAPGYTPPAPRLPPRRTSATATGDALERIARTAAGGGK